jgi:hypothetical protein
MFRVWILEVFSSVTVLTIADNVFPQVIRLNVGMVPLIGPQ